MTRAASSPVSKTIVFETFPSPLSNRWFSGCSFVSKPVSLSTSMNLAALTGSETPYGGSPLLPLPGCIEEELKLTKNRLS